MTFFYDLNKKLDTIREKPETTHKQLNEGAVAEVSDKKLAAYQAKADKQIASGQNVAKRTAGLLRTSHSARRNKGLDPYADTANLKNYPLGEEGMSRAAKGYEKYGKEGMQALAKAGREGKSLDKIRDKYNKYDEGVEEGLGDVVKKVGGVVKKVGKKALDTLGHPDDAEMLKDLQKKAGIPPHAQHGKPSMAKPKEGVDKKAFAALAEPKDKITFADKIAGAKKEVDEMLGDVAAEAMKNALRGGQKKLDKNNNGKLDANDFAMLRKGGKKVADEDVGVDKLEKAYTKHMGRAEAGGGDKERKRAVKSLYVAGADKAEQAYDQYHQKKYGVKPDREETEEGSTGDYSAKKARAGKDIGKPGKAFGKIAKGAAARYGSKAAGERVAGAVLNKLRHPGEEEMEEGWDDMLKDVEKRRDAMKTGEKKKTSKGEVEKTATGLKHTRSYDAKTGETDTGDDAPASGEKRGRGRPKGSKKAMGAKGPSGKSKLMTKEADHDGDKVKQAMAVLKKAGYKVSKANESAEELDEKAVSKAQQRFMGMAHAMQKGEKVPGASKELKKVAKTMKKGDVKDFAKTKHEGLPEKKKKEKTTEAGGTETPTASSGFSFGKGIYDSMNHELETMIAESMSINVSSSTEGGKNITVTASEEDAVKLAAILKSAGLGGGDSEGYGGQGYKSACGCGTPDCSCGDEQVDENSPDWPTNTETSNDALQYSGGLNKPKSTGQTTVPVIAHQDGRTSSYADEEEAAIKRMMEMAGIKEVKKVEEDDVEEGNKFTGNLAKARAAGKKEADLDGDGDMEKVRESVDQGILDATANLWSEYKGRYGV